MLPDVLASRARMGEMGMPLRVLNRTGGGYRLESGYWNSIEQAPWMRARWQVLRLSLASDRSKPLAQALYLDVRCKVYTDNCNLYPDLSQERVLSWRQALDRWGNTRPEVPGIFVAP